MSIQQSSQPQRQTDLIKTVLETLTNWDVKPQDQITLLGLPKDTKPRTLGRFRVGALLPQADDFLQRAHYILSIQNAVNSIFPHNAAAANYWVTTPNGYFGGKSPLEAMLNNDIEGMKYVVDHLNGVDGW